VRDPLASYPSLGIRFEYDVTGGLVKIRHVVDQQTSAQPHEVVRRSEQQLALLFESIEFLYGLPPEIAVRKARVMTAGNAIHRSVGIASLTLSAAMVHPLCFPAEATLRAASPRIAALLHLFNAARPPTSDAEAIRLCYLISEDLRGRPASPGASTPEQRLKLTRDFVSHGVKLDNHSAAAFIESRIGKPLTAFDPTDPAHEAFVAAQRAEAAALVEPQLRALL
jgi:hypothetical protein